MKGCDAAEAPKTAVIVNNCAAATFLALNSLAEGREVIVSRGALVVATFAFRKCSARKYLY
jgi:L-seryl-tRNA(Ser) seleniumtransferase